MGTCAKVAIVVEAGRKAVTLQGGNDDPRRLPGGNKRQNESWRDCAVRKCADQLGLELSPARLIPRCRERWRTDTGRSIDGYSFTVSVTRDEFIAVEKRLQSHGYHFSAIELDELKACVPKDQRPLV